MMPVDMPAGLWDKAVACVDQYLESPAGSFAFQNISRPVEAKRWRYIRRSSHVTNNVLVSCAHNVLTSSI